uniref:UFSP1/2/DUB catalytic domain-containing protein n=1 Tax=Ciona savignyi TaxID=51511 RepID=H2YTM1_CIOSA
NANLLMESLKLLRDVHINAEAPTKPIQCIKGHYSYYHYLCDGTDDRGWGCGYRTLQTIISWVHFNKDFETANVPSIFEIQKALVKMDDKPHNFISSKEWLGSFEVCLCLDYFCEVPCKIKHIRSGADIYAGLQILFDHFKKFGSPVMMGGDTDASSKCILGICGSCEEDCHLLILDPHCSDKAVTTQQLLNDKWVAWRSIGTLLKSSFYNLCLPQNK